MSNLHRLFLPTALALCASASAQRILIPQSTTDTVMEFDAFTGALVDMAVMDLGALTGGAAQTPIEIIRATNGEYWVSDQSADTVFRFSSDGSTFVGMSQTPLDNVRGLARVPDLSAIEAVVANAGTSNGAPGQALVQTNAFGTQVASATISNPYDVQGYTMGGVAGYLVGDISGDDIIFVDATDLTAQTMFHDSDGVTGIDFPEQIHVSITGRIYVAGFAAPSGIYEYDSLGNQIDYIDTGAIGGQTGIRGVVELLNGNLLFTNGGGVHVYDTTAGTITTEVGGVSGRFATMTPIGGLLPNYCMAALNSTGFSARMGAFGSPVAADNNITLVATGMPANQFGFFLTSQMQGFVPFPPVGNGNGNLCLGGVIGRFTMPGQVLNSGSGGTFSLRIDLTAIPEGGNLVAVASSDVWNFQAWFRDGVGLGSNFTDGYEINFN